MSTMIDADPIADLLPDLITLRRDLHAHPELAYAEERTAGIVGASLRLLGLEVEEGIGGTGVVGRLCLGSSTKTVGLRADMDALPMVELGRMPYQSRHPGVHHGCGHDGHVAMLIGAARELARRRDFDGTVNFIFQPAEEGKGGARKMIEDGLFERFPCDRVFALHNWPELPEGSAQTRPGAIMAAADRFDITIRSQGGHAAQPQRTSDAILAASQLIGQLHTIISRRVDPVESAVLSVTRVSGGHSHNVLPAEVLITGTVRTFDPAIQDAIETAIRDMVQGIAISFGVSTEVQYDRYYPATVNTPEEAAIALHAAELAGLKASEAPQGAFTSEDFAFMLQKKPGAYLWLGQGRTHGSAAQPLHSPHYDFNDDVLGRGVSWLCAVARLALHR
ncbi:M20 aminoacylase family protein [Ottowia thiooxydans]|uniref:M20 aminoacylase family protein n=1 Tax=Ottowia thiooxydans TaxID=219182 RepID=UPI00048BD203|nr:M20 aminoacylase family protein [Ottowia thiooxydans]